MKFIRIEKSVLVGKLLINDSSVLGWQVIFVYNNEKEIEGIEFREIKTSTTTSSTNEVALIPGTDYNFAVQEQQGQFALSIDESKLYEFGDESTQVSTTSTGSGILAGIGQYIQNLKAHFVNFGYCFFSRTDMKYLFNSSGNVLYFSLCKIDFMNSAFKENEYADFYYSLKVELLNEIELSNSDNSSGSIRSVSSSSGEETPVVLISMPCPPHWRPGFSGNVLGH